MTQFGVYMIDSTVNRTQVLRRGAPQNARRLRAVNGRTLPCDVEGGTQQFEPGVSGHIEGLIGNAPQDDGQEIERLVKFVVQ
jgi:hypothetical protein